jgi:hypothetical protein
MVFWIKNKFINIYKKKIEVIWDENKSRMSKNSYRNFSNTFGDEIV